MSAFAPQVGGYGFAPVLPKPDVSNTLADLKPLSFAGGMQSPLVFKPLPAWKVDSAHPELVAQGIASGTESLGKLVLEGFDKKAAIDVKTQELAIKKELRLAELAEKLEEKRAVIAERQSDPARAILLETRQLQNAKLLEEKKERLNGVMSDASQYFQNKNKTSEPESTKQDPSQTTFEDKAKLDELDEFSESLEGQNPLTQFKSDALEDIAYGRDFKPSILAEHIFASLDNAPKIQTREEVYDLSNIDPKYLSVSSESYMGPPAPVQVQLKAPTFDLNFDPRSDIFTNVIPERIPFTTVEKKRAVTSPIIAPTSLTPSQGLAELNFPSTQKAAPSPAIATATQFAPARKAPARKAPQSGFINTPAEAEEEALQKYEGYQSKGKIEYNADVINPVASAAMGRPIKGVWEVKRDPLSEADLQKQQELNRPQPEYNEEKGNAALAMRKALVQDQMYTSAREMSKKKIAVEESLSENNGFGDIIAINAFQKMIDEGVAVREGDVALIRSAQSFFSVYTPQFLKDKAGLGKILTPQDENSMRRMAGKIALLSKQSANRETIPFFKDLALKRGLDWKTIASDFDTKPTKDEVDSVVSVNRDTAAALEAQKIKIGSKDPDAIKRIDATIQKLLAASKSIIQEYTEGQK